VRWVLVGVVVLCFLLPSCIDDVEQAAVTASSDGGLRVLYHPCGADEPAETVQLLVDDGDTIGNGNDTVLWEAVASRGAIPTSDVMTFEPEKLPAGYFETVHLRTPEKGDKVIVYLTERAGGGFVGGFSWGSLEESTLVTDDGSKTRAAWLEYAREGCGLS